MKFFNKTAFIVLLTAFATIACTNQDLVEDMNYKNNDIKEIETTRLVEEQVSNDNEETNDLPTGQKDPIINIKRDRD